MYIGIRNWGLLIAVTATPAPEPTARAQIAGSVRVTPSADHVTIGDHITLTFVVDHAANASVVWPDSLPEISPFEQLSPGPTSAAQVSGNNASSEARYVVAAFELGELTFPAVPFAIVGSSDDTVQVSSQPITIVIATIGLESSEDIRGIKPPLEIPLSWLVVASWLGIATLVLAGAWFAYRRLTRRVRPSAPRRSGAPPRPAHVIAYEALERLEQSSLLENQRIQQWYSEVSNIIRVYIEGRYGVHAMEMATSDIMHGLEPFRLDYRSLDQFRDFFARADLVKFAKHRPTIDVCRALLESARKLVDVTREPDVVEPAGQSPSDTATAA